MLVVLVPPVVLVSTGIPTLVFAGVVSEAVESESEERASAARKMC